MDQKTQKRFLRGVKAFIRYQKLHEQETAAWKECGRCFGLDVGNGVGYSASLMADGKTWLTVEIMLADYLKLWPDAKPVPHTWDYNGKTYTRMRYPSQEVGETDNIVLFVDSQTESAAVSAV